MANERICIVCGSKYNYCSRCPGADKKQTWKNIYDTEDCMTLFNVCSSFKNNRISKNEANKQLKDIKIPTQLKKEYQDIIDSITFVPAPVIRKKPKVKPRRIVNEDLD